MPDKKSLSQKAVSGTIWNLSANVVAGLMRFGSTAVAAHYVSPEDFGVFSIAFVLLGIISLFKAYGLSAFLIHKKKCSDDYYSTAFWVNIAAGAILFILCLCLSPLAAMFYKNEILQSVLSLIALDFIIGELSTIHKIKLQKDLKFNILGLVEIVSSGLQAFVVIFLSVRGYGIWSLAWGDIGANIIATCVLINREKWYPKYFFNRHKFNEIFRFGRNILGESLCNYLSQNLDYLLIGKMLGMDSLGFYKMAYGLPHIVYENFPKKISPVLYPLLCNVRGDARKYKTAFLRMVSMVVVFAFPALSFLGYYAHDVILILYGPQWLSIAPLVQIIVILAMFRCLGTFVGSIINSQGRPDIGFKINLIKLPLFAVGIFIGVLLWGLPGVCWMMLIVEGLSVLGVYIYIGTLFDEAPTLIEIADVAVRGVVLALAPIFLIILFFYTDLWLDENYKLWLRFGISALVWVVSWLGIYAFFWKKDFVEAYHLLMTGFGFHKS